MILPRRLLRNRFLRPKRVGMTLVEIMIVMAIMVMMAAVVAAFFPGSSADNQVTSFSNKLQGGFVSVRNRSKSEKLPTGIRFYRDNQTMKCIEAVLIQKPADVTGQNLDPLYPNGILVSASSIKLNPNPPIPMGALSFLDSSGNPYEMYNPNKGSLLNNGDVIRFDETGDLCQVYGPAVNVLGPPVANYVVDLGASTRPFDGRDIAAITPSGATNYSSGFLAKLTQMGPTKKYRIIRQPIEFSGDPPFEMPEGYELILNTNSTFSPAPAMNAPYWANNTQVYVANPYSILPTVVATANPLISYVDIYFNESGSLQSPTEGDVFIWLHNGMATAGDYKNDAIIAIRKLTGGVGVFPVQDQFIYSTASQYVGPDPFELARDPNNRGL